MKNTHAAVRRKDLPPTRADLEARRRRDLARLELAWRRLTAPGAEHVAVLAGIVVQRMAP
ncbi:MAG: hypothetical protein IT481_01525 [Gammaproteobacteria bacterium]|nr:hypothetical protein [Gammaproteobacteria bacterium]